MSTDVFQAPEKNDKILISQAPTVFAVQLPVPVTSVTTATALHLPLLADLICYTAVSVERCAASLFSPPKQTRLLGQLNRSVLVIAVILGHSMAIRVHIRDKAISVTTMCVR